jgi:hypothetical protein
MLIIGFPRDDCMTGGAAIQLKRIFGDISESAQLPPGAHIRLTA